MNYSSFNDNTRSVRRYRSNFLTSMYKPRFYPRYLRQRTYPRMRTYGIPAGQRRANNFLQPSRKFRRYPQQRLQYWVFHKPTSMNTHKPANHWQTAANIVNRILRLFSFIYRIVHYIQAKSASKLGAWGCSANCVCGGVAVTSVVIVTGIALGVGLGIELRGNEEFMNSTLTMNSTLPITSTTATIFLYII